MVAARDARPLCLVVDDEPELAAVIGDYLKHEGFGVQTVGDGEAAVEVARNQLPDVIVLDLMLPGIDGVEVCRQIRTFSDAYVLMLTARSDEVDKLIGLSVGADDYMTKPFSPRELVARVKVLMRRPRAGATDSGTDVRTFGPLTIDLSARLVSVDSQSVELTRTEFDLLAALSREPKLAFTRRQLVDAVWGPDWFGDDHIVDVHLAHVRRKLGDDASAPKFVRTVRGIGYGMGTGE